MTNFERDATLVGISQSTFPTEYPQMHCVLHVALELPFIRGRTRVWE